MKIPSVRFVFARKGVSKKEGKGNVEMVITYNGSRKFLSTGVSVYPSCWHEKKMVFGSGEDLELNNILLTMRKKALQIISTMVDRGVFDINAIAELMKAKNVDMTFLDYVYSRMAKKDVTEYTQKSYVSFYNKLSEYGKIKFFGDITEKAIRDFDEWLHQYKWSELDRYGKKITKRYSQATIGSYHKNMKNFISDAVIDGYLPENVYVSKGIKIDKGKTRIDEYLVEEEVAAIAKAEMPTRPLSEAKDLFLLQCYSGMAYVDLMSFDFSRLKDTVSGSIVHGERHKTHTQFSFVLTDESKAILEKYKYMLPKLPNQQYNTKLKLIADAAGIDKNVTSHMGRRSAGSIWLNKGIPLEVVSKCLGHSSLSTTQKAYAKILDDTIVEAFAKIKKSGV